MTRLFVTRLLTVLVLATGLAASTFAASASAAPATGASAPSAVVATTTGPSTGDVEIQADPCGFFTRWDAYYNHCGSSDYIWIRVNFWYGASTRDIRVWQGTSNLSTHPELQGQGLITNAHCIRYC